jgi:hypothetical protein
MGSFVPFIPSLAEGPAPSGASGSAPYVTFERSPQPAGSRLREESTPSTSSAQPERTPRADKNKSVRATREVGARKFALSNPHTRRLAWREPAYQLFRGSASPMAGGSLPRRSLAGLPRAEPRGDTFRGNENKPLRAFSNRKSNDSRKLATLSKSMTSKFLIATKMHLSEEKAKSEQKTKPLRGITSASVDGAGFSLTV